MNEKDRFYAERTEAMIKIAEIEAKAKVDVAETIAIKLADLASALRYLGRRGK